MRVGHRKNDSEDHVALLGQPGTKYIELVPKAKGECLLKMVLAREWEYSWASPDSGVYISKNEFNVRVFD